MDIDYSLLIFTIFIAEQIVMVKLGSYPYLWGIPFSHRVLPKDLAIEDVGGFTGRLTMKQDEDGNIFIRYKHFPLTWGPYVFVGQARKEEPTKLIIRLGPLTGLFFIGFIVLGLLDGLFTTVGSLFTVSFFLWYFYSSFLRGYEKMITKSKSEI